MFLKFESLSHPVRLAQGLKVLPHLLRVCEKWRYREIPGVGAMPDINVMQDGENYVLQAPWVKLEQRYADAAGLADGLGQHLARAWLREHPENLVLQAAASTFGDGLVVFVGGPGSGKSLLVACLAANGQQAFADSLLPVAERDRTAFALGLAPRIRLPLPESLSEGMRGLVEERVQSGAEGLGYLTSRGRAALAAHGERSNIRAFVILDRRDGADAALRPVADSVMLKRLLLGSIDGFAAPGMSLGLLHELVLAASCHRLTWSDPQPAVAALRGRFAIRRLAGAEDDSAPKNLARTRRRRQSGPRAPSGRLFRHGGGLAERQVDNDLFLVDSAGEAVYHLNGLGAGMWRLLDGSHGLDDVVAVLHDAFPTVDRALISDDVEKLVADLTERGLLVERTTQAV